MNKVWIYSECQDNLLTKDELKLLIKKEKKTILLLFTLNYLYSNHNMLSSNHRMSEFLSQIDCKL